LNSGFDGGRKTTRGEPAPALLDHLDGRADVPSDQPMLVHLRQKSLNLVGDISV
jgi:hypothetical protein